MTEEETIFRYIHTGWKTPEYNEKSEHLPCLSKKIPWVCPTLSKKKMYWPFLHMPAWENLEPEKAIWLALVNVWPQITQVSTKLTNQGSKWTGVTLPLQSRQHARDKGSIKSPCLTLLRTLLASVFTRTECYPEHFVSQYQAFLLESRGVQSFKQLLASMARMTAIGRRDGCPLMRIVFVQNQPTTQEDILGHI